MLIKKIDWGEVVGDEVQLEKNLACHETVVSCRVYSGPTKLKFQQKSTKF